MKVGEDRLVLPDGSPMPTARILGRGADRHLLAGAEWFRLNLTEIPRTANWRGWVNVADPPDTVELDPERQGVADVG